jgi:hypothetical protein
MMNHAPTQLALNTEDFLRSLDTELRHLGRSRESVTVIAVSKTRPVEVINTAIQAGLREFGENRMQEAQIKIPALTEHENLRWHMIGHLQSNKVRDAVGLFDMIQSVDRYALAQLIDRRATMLGHRQDILIQVNTTDEEQKSGCDPDEAGDLVIRIAELPGLRVMGLMTIGPLTEDEIAIARAFEKLHRLYDHLAECNLHGGRMRYCSMGMTNDWKIALAEGSNMLRIGRAIFGERDNPAPAAS